jgi:RNA polymerase sigma factor (TIGR02999 family)
MGPEQDGDITALLSRWKNGDAEAGNRLITALYPLLKQIAAQNVRRYNGALTLRATELLHEAFERLHAQSSVDWKNRDQLLAVATTVMQRTAIDYLRGRGSAKRGSGVAPLSLDSLHEDALPAADHDAACVDLERAMSELGALNPTIAAVAELKLYCGLTQEDVAGCCDISTATVVRHWRFARAWLADRLELTDAGD